MHPVLVASGWDGVEGPDVALMIQITAAYNMIKLILKLLNSYWCKVLILGECQAKTARYVRMIVLTLSRKPAQLEAWHRDVHDEWKSCDVFQCTKSIVIIGSVKCF